MTVRYRGKALREAHHIGLRAMARALGIRHATLVALEHNRWRCLSPELLASIVTYFQAQGIPCEPGDLLVYEASGLGEGGGDMGIDSNESPVL